MPAYRGMCCVKGPVPRSSGSPPDHTAADAASKVIATANWEASGHNNVIWFPSELGLHGAWQLELGGSPDSIGGGDTEVKREKICVGSRQWRLRELHEFPTSLWEVGGSRYFENSGRGDGSPKYPRTFQAPLSVSRHTLMNSYSGKQLFVYCRWRCVIAFANITFKMPEKAPEHEMFSR